MKKKILLILSSVIILLVIGFYVYVGNYYKYTPEEEYLNVDYISLDDGSLVFESNSNVGLIFYPGGKVEYSSYIPLMKELSDCGITCILVDMPFNLAVLDVNRADGLTNLYSNIEHWYIGGHSLGGSMAASYLEKNLDEFEGLILLGSYSTVDLSDIDIKVLSIYGENDLVLNKEKYEKYKPNIDDNLTQVVIEGGNHAYFGMYGNQSGDGEASISNKEQINITVNNILDFIS